jgi:hypothetical protein
VAFAARLGAALNGVSRSVSFGAVLAILSFVIYTSTLFVLPQVRNPCGILSSGKRAIFGDIANFVPRLIPDPRDELSIREPIRRR